MTEQETHTTQAADLRRKAEETIRGNADQSPEDLLVMPSCDYGETLPQDLPIIAQTLHELQLHQVELEMQNKYLHRTQVELEIARARYFDLYELAPVGYLTVSEKGLIMEANFTASSSIIKEDQGIFCLRASNDFRDWWRRCMYGSGRLIPRGITPTAVRGLKTSLATNRKKFLEKSSLNRCLRRKRNAS